MTEIKNLLFQPLTFHRAGKDEGLHLNPRERKEIPDADVSEEMRLAAKRRFIALVTDASHEEGGM